MASKVTAATGTGGRGRSLGLMAKDILEGYVALNPIVLKKFDPVSMKELHQHLRKLQTSVRIEGVNLANQEATRTRNQKLQRLHQAISVLENHAKLQRIVLTT